jgi:sterol desaturase/sphingolipid hydroxylase (fatty acid hydroxylase superfamily)
MNLHSITENATSLEILLYAGLMLLLWLTEIVVLSARFKSKCSHMLTNIKFIVTALPVQLMMTIPLLKISAFMNVHHLGLLYLPYLRHSLLLNMIVGFLVLDFCDYLYHVIMHKTKPLWKFHLVHHTDQMMDVTTTVREHPGETFCRTCFLMIWVTFTGAGFGLLLLRQTFQTIVNITSHTSFRLNKKTDRWLGYLFVTPNIHHVHHHYELPYTDCNYGDVLSIWDRLFGTYKELDAEQTRFGVDVCMDNNVHEHFVPTLKIPFTKSVEK